MINGHVSKPTPPFVYIVGAGPGDPNLLTLKAYDIMQHCCDIVVYDRLIPDAIMALVPSHVEKIYAGKSCRQHVMTQGEINQTLVDQAMLQKVVLRLKGGDPFIFGRGREEVESLIMAKVPFEVVPGVNAADGSAAYAGIPLTHRGVANSVRFITGHQQKGAAIAFDWQGLAEPQTTLVIFMGLANLKEIVQRLIAHGLDQSTPAAIIENGTMSNQRVLIASLINLCDVAKNAAIKPPSIVIIGKVVSLHNKT